MPLPPVPPLGAPPVPPPEPPPLPAGAAPAAVQAPWAWAAAVVLGQPNAHRLVRAFFFGLIGLLSVLLGAARACR